MRLHSEDGSGSGYREVSTCRGSEVEVSGTNRR